MNEDLKAPTAGVKPDDGNEDVDEDSEDDDGVSNPYAEVSLNHVE